MSTPEQVKRFEEGQGFIAALAQSGASSRGTMEPLVAIMEIS